MNDVELLKQSCKVLGITQKQLAARLDVNAVSVSRWVSGKRNPGPEIFRQVLELVVTHSLSVQERQSFVNDTAKRLNNQ